MTYEEARGFIDQSNKYGNELSLEAITELLSRLGNPQDKLKVIHVAGTNGKGSTTAFLSSILSMEGYRTGRYISPTVFCYRERIQISHMRQENETQELEIEYITEQGVGDSIVAIKTVCEAMLQEGFPHPTPFEIETAMAMLYFYWQQVDYAIIEVGLGGRLDATNVFKKPVCCVITSISIDHMQYLGDSLTQIAGEKAGIIKTKVPVITNNKTTEVLKVLQKKCEAKETTLTVADPEEGQTLSVSVEGTVFRYHNKEYEIKLLGEHQIANAILAIATVNILRQTKYSISEDSIKQGLLLTKWNGRLEVIGREPYFVIDGAHNEDAAHKLFKAILLYFTGRRIIYIMGVFADKDYRKILSITAPIADLILTLTPNNTRALPSSELATEAKKYCPAVIDANTTEQAVIYAYEAAKAEDVIIAFGSLSFLGELKELVINR